MVEAPCHYLETSRDRSSPRHFNMVLLPILFGYSRVSEVFVPTRNFLPASSTKITCRAKHINSMSSLHIVTSMSILPPDNILATVRTKTKRKPSAGRFFLNSTSKVTVWLIVFDFAACPQSLLAMDQSHHISFQQRAGRTGDAFLHRGRT